MLDHIAPNAASLAEFYLLPARSDWRIIGCLNPNVMEDASTVIALKTTFEMPTALVKPEYRG